jgi:3-hydroxybutyryl-CoA dehydratase
VGTALVAMNEYTFSQISEGMQASFSHTFTQEQITTFAQLTGDMNPLHTDAQYAKATPFAKQVVHGQLVASLLSTMAGVYLPGKHCLILKVTSEFTKPVFVDDTVQYTATVTKKHGVGNMVTISVQAMNSQHVQVLRSELLVQVRV